MQLMILRMLAVRGADARPLKVKRLYDSALSYYKLCNQVKVRKIICLDPYSIRIELGVVCSLVLVRSS